MGCAHFEHCLQLISIHFNSFLSVIFPDSDLEWHFVHFSVVLLSSYSQGSWRSESVRKTGMKSYIGLQLLDCW